MRMNYPVSMLALLTLAACASEPTVTTTTTTTQVTTTGPVREVVVTRPPPPVRVETQTVAPASGYVWTPGYWRWTGTSYVWISGSWVVRPEQQPFGCQGNGCVVQAAGLGSRATGNKNSRAGSDIASRDPESLAGGCLSPNGFFKLFLSANVV